MNNRKIIQLSKKALKAILPALGTLIFIFTFIPLKAIAGNTRNEETSSPVQTDTIQKLWQERLKFLNSGEVSNADVKIEEIFLERLRKAYANLQIYSAALIKESQDKASQDDMKRAYELLYQARDLSPDFYGTYALQWRYRIAEGIMFDAAKDAITSTTKKYSAFTTGYPAVYNGVIKVMISFYWLVLLYAGFLLARYVKFISHDIQERIPGMDRRGAIVMTAVLAVFPSVFIPSLLIYAITLILMMWIYISLREKIIAAILVLMILPLPFSLHIVANGLFAYSEPAFESAVLVREGIWSAKDVEILSKAAQEQNDKLTRENILISLAKALTYSQKYEEALARLSEIGPGELDELVSLQKGNAYYYLGNYREALKWFKEAVNKNPNNPVAHYNYATVLGRPEIVEANADSVKLSEQEIGRVKDIAPDKLNIWTKYQDLDPTHNNPIIIDMPIPLGRIWDELLNDTEKRKNEGGAAYKFLMGGIGVNATIIVIVVVLIMMGALTFLEKYIPHARGCRICGIPVCMECRAPETNDYICSRCKSVFESKTGLDPRTSQRVKADVRLQQDKLVLASEIMSIFVPGTGHLLLGKSIRGIIFSFVSVTMIFVVALRNGVLRSEWFLPMPANMWLIGILSFFYAIFVGLTVWDISRNK